MKVAIIGSRTAQDLSKVYEATKDLNVTTVISGGAEGADKLAELYALYEGKELIVIPADWNTYGRSAGVRRNAEIVELADMVVAFWDGQSNGTRDTIQKARRAGKLTRVVYIYPSNQLSIV